METLRIFIASSSELEAERKAFREYLSSENDRLHKKGLYLQLVQWEHFLDAVSHTRLQDEYNAELKQCDIVVCLFYTKAGEYTIEEFDTALAQFRYTGKPLIYTYFKNGAPPASDNDAPAQRLETFKKRLSEIGHFYTRFDNAEGLLLHFRRQLDLLEDKDFFAVRDSLREETKEVVTQYLLKNKAFNEHLARRLIEAIGPYAAPAQRFLEKVADIPGWESQLRISDKAKEIVAYSFVGVIGIQWSKLMAIGKEDFSDAKQRKYIDRCIKVAQYAIDLLSIALLSKLWDEQQQQARQFADAERQTLDTFFQNSFEFSLPERLQFLQALDGIFANPAYALPPPLPDWPGFSPSLAADSTWVAACRGLAELQDRLDKEKYNLLDCFEAEQHLARFLSQLAFLTQYRMASIRHVGYWQPRNADARYLHRYTALGIDNKANKDAEKMNCTPETVQTDAALLYRDDSYNRHISLSPFIIDYNALTFEHGAKICFYRSRAIDGDILEYIFHEDDSLVRLENKGILRADTDLNELMLEQQKQKILNIDNVVGLFHAARACLLGEVDFEDL